jgi:carotenoid cleavage dioxygenase
MRGLAKLTVFGMRTVFGIVDLPVLKQTTANTAVVFHNGKLLALSEAGLPYQVGLKQDGVMETNEHGFSTPFQEVANHPFCAHPKIDPVTGDMFFFGYNIQSYPYMQYTVVDKAGKLLVPPSDVPLKEPLMMHDMGLTEKYAIALDLNLKFRPNAMVSGKGAFSYDTR